MKQGVDEIRIGIAGLGTVAQGVIELVHRNGELMNSRSGTRVKVVRVASRQAKSDVDLGSAQFSTDLDDLLSDPEVDVVVELIGGETVALELIRQALAAGKGVVTANKAVIAANGNELVMGNSRGRIRFEAAVAGAIPIIQAMQESLVATRFFGLQGIINGTCNYILSVMESEGASFDEVLAQAQALGYAEAEPSFDVDGIDAAHKLTILLALGFSGSFDFEAIYIEGIRQITMDDIRYCDEFGYKIKHLGIVKETDQGYEARVHPALVAKSALLAHVSGVTNAVQLDTDAAAQTLFSGPGAGGLATASAVLADVINMAGQPGSESSQADKHLRAPQSQAKVAPISQVVSANYLRVPTLDRPGVFAQVGNALSKHDISIEAVIQKEPSSAQKNVDIALITNEVPEVAMLSALEELATLESVIAPTVRIRLAPTTEAFT